MKQNQKQYYRSTFKIKTVHKIRSVGLLSMFVVHEAAALSSIWKHGKKLRFFLLMPVLALYFNFQEDLSRRDSFVFG